MAGELQALVPSGLTLYAVILDSAGQIWNGTAFEAINSANWATYDIALTESAAGIYLGDLPALDAGIYTYNVYERAGASPATTDVQVGNGWLNWDGAAILPLSTVDTVVDAILVDTGTDIPALLATVQADLDDPSQYKADVSGLALEASIDDIKGAGWVDENLTTINANVNAILVDTGTTLNDKLDIIDNIVDAILVDTGTTLDDKLDVIDGIVDAILVDTGIDIPALIATMQADLDDTDQYKANVPDIADAVWDEMIAGHLLAGSTGEALSGLDTVNIIAAIESIRSIIRQYSSVVSRNTSCNQIELRRSANFKWEVFGIGDLTGRSSLYFTVKYMKEKDSASDAQSIIQIEESAGLLYINKNAASNPANGSITVTDELAGTMTIELTAEETDKLAPNESYLYDIKSDNNVLEEGKFLVLSSITRTVA